MTKAGPVPGKKVPAPEKLVIAGIVVCEEGELLTPEEFDARVGRAMAKAFGRDPDAPPPPRPRQG